MATRSLASLSDDTLLLRLAEILSDARRVEADLVAHIAEVDERRLFLREACSSMFAYCVERLHLSEPETALRIVVARASRRHPVLLDMLRDGRLHLSGIALLSPHLDQENRDEVLARASHLSKRQVEELVAELAPRRDAPTLVRRLPSPWRGRVEVTPRPGRRAPLPAPPIGQHRPDDVAGAGKAADVAADGTEPADLRATGAPSAGTIGLQLGLSDRVRPLAPSRYRVQFTASAGLKKKLERLQVLMRMAVPDGDLATLIETQ